MAGGQLHRTLRNDDNTSITDYDLYGWRHIGLESGILGIETGNTRGANDRTTTVRASRATVPCTILFNTCIATKSRHKNGVCTALPLSAPAIANTMYTSLWCANEAPLLGARSDS
jgi:hypothetical protein